MANLTPESLSLALLVVFAGCTSGETIRPDPGGAGNGAGAGGDAGAGGSAGAGASGASGASGSGISGAGGGPLVCPSGRGPKMVGITLPGVTSFCIDSTEVSQSQYAEFLEAKMDPAKQSRANCVKKNLNFTPIMNLGPEDWKDCPKGTYDPATKGDLPVSCVDHCDAIAYCEWAGKRLCGAVGGGTLAWTGEDAASLNRGEWYLACSQGGKLKYQYGETYEKGKCGEPAPDGSTPPVFTPSAPSECRGQAPPFDGVYDLVGNMAEWEDMCQADGICSVRGGGAGVVLPAIDCTTVGLAEAYNRGSVGFGIRCCASGI